MENTRYHLISRTRRALKSLSAEMQGVTPITGSSRFALPGGVLWRERFKGDVLQLLSQARTDRLLSDKALLRTLPSLYRLKYQNILLL